MWGIHWTHTKADTAEDLYPNEATRHQRATLHASDPAYRSTRTLLVQWSAMYISSPLAHIAGCPLVYPDVREYGV